MTTDRDAMRLAASDSFGAGIAAAIAETEAAIARCLRESPSAGNALRLERLEERLREDHARHRRHAESHARLLSEGQS